MSPRKAKILDAYKKVQRDADLAVYQSREEYHKKLISELVEQTRREVRLDEAEWLEKWSANREHLGAAYQQIIDHIVALRQGSNMQKMHNAPFSDGKLAGIVQNVHNTPDVKVTWPNERYSLDGEGCREK
jgi:hypothetical protein